MRHLLHTEEGKMPPYPRRQAVSGAVAATPVTQVETPVRIGKMYSARKAKGTMANFAELLGFGGSAKRAVQALERLASERATLSVTIEGTQTRFKSRVLLKDNQVIFAKPASAQDGVRVGKFVRFRIPDEPSKEVRLEIAVPQVNLASGSSVFVCKTPEEGLTTSKRQADRLGLAHLSNVLLVMPDHSREFRLTDISATGCRVMTSPPEAKTFLPVGRELNNVFIQVGSKAKVELKSFIPRAHRRNSVGCEFTVKAEGTSLVYLQRLIDTLERG
jgi:hypothetical protein